MSYQSFGRNQGASNSFEKLLALRIPDLNEKSFLDVGCNVGFSVGMPSTRVRAALWE